MGSTFRRKVVSSFFCLAAIMLLITSCVSTGSSSLSSKNADKIISGKTTKNQVAKVLGEPEQMLKLDKEGLQNYLSRVQFSDSSPPDFGEGLYEVWIYNGWTHLSALVLTPSYEKAKLAIIVIDDQGICIEKFYMQETDLRF
jgi:hypothetical protein